MLKGAVIGPAMVEWIPRMAIAIAEGITQFILTIAEKIPEIIEAGKTILPLSNSEKNSLIKCNVRNIILFGIIFANRTVDK